MWINKRRQRCKQCVFEPLEHVKKNSQQYESLREVNDWRSTPLNYKIPQIPSNDQTPLNGVAAWLWLIGQNRTSPDKRKKKTQCYLQQGYYSVNSARHHSTTRLGSPVRTVFSLDQLTQLNPHRTAERPGLRVKRAHARTQGRRIGRPVAHPGTPAERLYDNLPHSSPLVNNYFLGLRL